MTRTQANGKTCYIEIPAVDIGCWAEFYEKVFVRRIRRRGDRSIAFDDATGQVSGTWLLGRPSARAPGFLIYSVVDGVAGAIKPVIAHGGELAQPIGADTREITARFLDPAGNAIDLYQEPSRQAAPDTPGVSDQSRRASPA
jgi:predicted enzyme related to lactoylglutathione lyase